MDRKNFILRQVKLLGKQIDLIPCSYILWSHTVNAQSAPCAVAFPWYEAGAWTVDLSLAKLQLQMVQKALFFLLELQSSLKSSTAPPPPTGILLIIIKSCIPSPLFSL